MRSHGGLRGDLEQQEFQRRILVPTVIFPVIDFAPYGSHLGIQMEPKWRPKSHQNLGSIPKNIFNETGVQREAQRSPNDVKIDSKSFQEATCTEKAEKVKIALAPPREHYNQGPSASEVDQNLIKKRLGDRLGSVGDFKTDLGSKILAK